MDDWTDHHTRDLAHVATRPATRLAQTTQPSDRAAPQRQATPTAAASSATTRAHNDRALARDVGRF